MTDHTQPDPEYAALCGDAAQAGLYLTLETRDGALGKLALRSRTAKTPLAVDVTEAGGIPAAASQLRSLLGSA